MKNKYTDIFDANKNGEIYKFIFIFSNLYKALKIKLITVYNIGIRDKSLK